MAKFGSTGRAAATYISLAGLQRGVSLLILPFVTNVMPPNEYGAAAMLSNTAVLATAVLASPIIQLVVRAAARRDEDGPALLRVAGLYCYLVLPIALGLAAAAVSVLVPNALGVPGKMWAIELLAVGFQPATFAFAMWVARAREDLPRFVWLSLTSIVAMTASKIVFVVILRLGVLGWVLSELCSAVLAAILAAFLVRLPKTVLSTNNVKQALAFALPLIPHTAALWAITSLSRPALAAVSSLEQLGLLSFALSLTTVAGIVLTECNAALLPRYAREKFPAPTAETLGGARWQLVGAFVVPAVIGCGIATAGQWLFAEPYWPSFLATGLLLVGQSAYGVYVIPMNYLTQTAGLPRFSSLASGTGAMMILILIIALGHKYGAVGASVATVSGYMSMAAVALILTKKCKLLIKWRSWFPFWPELSLAIAALSSSVGALAAPVGSTYAWILAGICLVFAVGATVLTSRRQPA